MIQQVAQKDEKGDFVYDQAKIEAARKQLTKEAERFNSKLAKAQAQGRMMDYSLLNVSETVEVQLRLSMHNFRLVKSVPFGK